MPRYSIFSAHPSLHSSARISSGTSSPSLPTKRTIRRISTTYVVGFTRIALHLRRAGSLRRRRSPCASPGRRGDSQGIESPALYRLRTHRQRACTVRPSARLNVAVTRTRPPRIRLSVIQFALRAERTACLNSAATLWLMSPEPLSAWNPSRRTGTGRTGLRAAAPSVVPLFVSSGISRIQPSASRRNNSAGYGLISRTAHGRKLAFGHTTWRPPMVMHREKRGRWIPAKLDEIKCDTTLMPHQTSKPFSLLTTHAPESAPSPLLPVARVLPSPGTVSQVPVSR